MDSVFFYFKNILMNSFDYSIKLFTLSIVLSFFYSCSSVQHISLSSRIDRITNEPCVAKDSINQFFSYFQGEQLDFKYNAIAQISIQNGNHDEGDPLEILKETAVKQCADGILNLNYSSSNGRYNITNYDSYKNKCTNKWETKTSVSTHEFLQNRYTALAVKVLDSTELSKARLDEYFVQRYNNRKGNPIYKPYSEDYVLQIIGAILLLPLAIIASGAK